MPALVDHLYQGMFSSLIDTQGNLHHRCEVRRHRAYPAQTGQDITQQAEGILYDCIESRDL